MPSRVSILKARCSSLAIRPKSLPKNRWSSIGSRAYAAPAGFHHQRRMASDDAKNPKKTQASEDFKGPTQDALPHITEETAAMDKILGETPPDIEQGTPVQEILKRDKEAQKNAPKVLKDSINAETNSSGKPPGSRSFSTFSASRFGSRSFSTIARRNAEATAELVRFEDTRAVGLEYPDAGFGHKFPLPDITKFPKTNHIKKRYDEVLEQVTRSIMRHGKLSRAQKNMDEILDNLRKAPVPSAGEHGLLTDLPRDELPLSPVQYLTAIIDSVAPLVRIRQLRGLMGGGASMPVPVPLNRRQRRRAAIQWILAGAENRRETRLAERVSKELIAVAEGRGSAWERRQRVHKMAISTRANVKTMLQGPRKRGGGK
ncbi:hypothetical protein HRR83_005148 [Exophiala dermatitidis]|uniref:Small ribosomal subunit protein uS7m n=2 Tax=Exophiala dermatitidis TaxID=5970 RepID=H6C2X6_EXODN|nr:30S ribosomal protein S5e [Exophiala dermatitidis NIH/UT8656]KAJ4513706.1 hypothetical protein HRR75_004286 [Exophiala dermatitidis]EHY57991.1 30S ribosomal protein S5e [Exophiala dermatitidis NIH/UT8656]KAJ4516938.1 hypothetical protein HRR74_004687 [Exophiala dermatitidis]KAJ4519883.1 hypothetical protein HRR73_003944 [Exophiala dermatitidis]KAJ4534309.1 hypothetical protein HRR76_006237 [Exophiala dermatitidis]